jgi:tetratricopeptide (TPR) repeat protein
MDVVLRPAAVLKPRPHLWNRRYVWLAFILLALSFLLPSLYCYRQKHLVERDWREAQSCLAKHDLESAATHLERYLSNRPDDAAAWLLAARTARRLEHIEDARRYLERCQQLSGVTDSTRLEWDLLRVQQGDIGGIDVRLRQSIGPDHPDALFVLEALARGYIRSERLAEAVQACDLWIAQQPEHPWPWLWRGSIYERLNHRDRAISDYRRAVQNAPDKTDARMLLGSALLRERQPGPAAEQYEAILVQSPNETAAQVGLAACRMEQARTSEAIVILDRVLDSGGASSLVFLLRGKAALEQDRSEDAEHWLREAVRLAPYDPEALYQLSLSLRSQQKEDEAASVSQRVDRLRTDFVRLDELIRAIARKSDDPQLRHEAGVIALRVGRTEEALRWLQSLLLLSGDHRDTHIVLMGYYQDKGDRERAEFHRRQAETR